MSKTLKGTVRTFKPHTVVMGFVAALYVLVVVFFLLFQGISRRTPDAEFARAEYNAEDIVADPTRIPARKGNRAEPVDVYEIVKPTPERSVEGRESYAMYCSSCHGPEGRGNGPAAAALDPPPRNFMITEGWKNGHRVSDIFRTLTEGIAGTGMTSFDTLEIRKRFALAQYVRSLMGFDPEDDTPESLARLDRDYNLSAGASLPNMIPVELAIEKLLAESEAAPPPALADGQEVEE